MQDADDFSTRVVLVTGASRGIGLEIAKAFHARGARVALAARGAEKLAEATASLGDRALGIEMDVSDKASVDRGVAEVVERFGAIHVLVNNAAVGRLSKIVEVSDRDLEDQVAINFLGPVYCVRAVVPHMRAAGGGDVLNVSSDSVLRPFPYLGIYGASKAALETLTVALRQELAPENIRVALLRSGPSLTGFASEWSPEDAGPAFEEWTAGDYLDPQSVMHPETVAEAAVFLVAQAREASVYTLDVRPRRQNPLGG